MDIFACVSYAGLPHRYTLGKFQYDGVEKVDRTHYREPAYDYGTLHTVINGGDVSSDSPVHTIFHNVPALVQRQKAPSTPRAPTGNALIA